MPGDGARCAIPIDRETPAKVATEFQEATPSGDTGMSASQMEAQMNMMQQSLADLQAQIIALSSRQAVQHQQSGGEQGTGSGVGATAAQASNGIVPGAMGGETSNRSRDTTRAPSYGRANEQQSASGKKTTKEKETPKRRGPGGGK